MINSHIHTYILIIYNCGTNYNYTWQKFWQSMVSFGLYHGNNQVESSSFLMLTVELLKWVSKKKKKKVFWIIKAKQWHNDTTSLEFPKTEKVNAVHDAKCYTIKRLVATVYLDFATDLIGNFRIPFKRISWTRLTSQWVTTLYIYYNIHEFSLLSWT